MTSSTIPADVVNHNPVSLDDLAARLKDGEPITAVAAAIGWTWQKLHTELGRVNLLPETLPRPACRPSARRTGEKALKRLVRREVRKALRQPQPATTGFEVRWPDDQTTRVTGKCHEHFPWILQLAACRKNILLVGPAGCGKTHLAAQVAQALGLPFAHISCSAGMSEGQLLGRLIPTGKGGSFQYVRSEFVRCYEEGGVFLFDEIDAADSNTLLVLNAALANGQMAVPNRPEKPVAKKHPDFICLAAANTFGTGADRQYVGRSQLDESTLDRFRIGVVEMDYDADVEAALCPDAELRERLQGYRRRIREAKLRRVVSTRFLRDAFDMKRIGASDEQIDAALFRGWSPDEIVKVRGR